MSRLEQVVRIGHAWRSSANNIPSPGLAVLSNAHSSLFSPSLCQALYFPPHVGLPLGGEDSPKNFLLEMHYDNPGNIVGECYSKGKLNVHACKWQLMIIVVSALSFPRYCLTTDQLVSNNVPLKQLKQILQMEHKMVKNPSWRDANQLATYKRS